MSKKISNVPSYSSRDKAFYRQVALLHMKGINRGFLPQLGQGFMTLLYEAIDGCNASVLIVEIENNEVIGFVSGAASMKPLYRQLLCKPLLLLMTLLPSLIRPQRLKRIYEILRYSSSANIDEELTLPEFELLSIVVAPAARGTGCSGRLYQKMIEYCEQQQIETFKIIVGDALAPAHRFYQRMGAKPLGRIEVHAGKGSVIYEQVVPTRGKNKNG
ncbi:N-acetyltransferase family protein [Desulfosediminicola sp.]|uniref:GNAT family N-acetyltransferase n=1 Tax=Desulfosediminicola sp. TaxID=2886825 RepID=UPI003AF2EB0E